MQDIIRLLPDSLANQIAAGEVVQRPASVVKELLENSVDADSKNIRLIVKEAGKTWIQVIDDGKGMSEIDARMCFERHATSKLKTTDDLFNILTFGFRGEAMASIAAVAQVEMKTRQDQEELGTKIVIEGSKVIAQEACQTSEGTNLIVKNLFFNVPARRNFLKTNSVELRHIIDEFIRVALAYPEVAMSLYVEDDEMYNLKSGNIAHRIVGLFGKTYKEQIIPCSEEIPAIKIKGYIGKPEIAKKTRGEQFIFANNRFIKHSYLHHAIMTGYEGILPPDTFPFYAIYIEIDPKKIDINVHPTKTEIKFEDEKVIYAIINAAVKRALGKSHVVSPLDFDLDANYMLAGRLKTETEYNLQSDKEIDKQTNNLTQQPYNPFDRTQTTSINKKSITSNSYTNFRNTTEQNYLKNWEMLYQENKETAEEDLENQQDLFAITLTSAISQTQNPETKTTIQSERTVFQLHNAFIISQVKSGLLLIDQQAASERILYERFIHELDKKHGVSQRLLFPQTLQLSTADIIVLTELESELPALGFEIETLSNNTICLKGIPADLRNVNEKSMLEGLIEQYKMNRSTIQIPKYEAISMAMAKQFAVRRGTVLVQAETSALIAQLFACQNPNYTADGKKVFAILDMNSLDSLLG
jgi:DNA mismatch repair protein MutL